MADHSKPTLASKYVDFIDEMKGRFEDVSRGFDPEYTSATNIPTNTIRWVGASRKWQRWNGTAWVDLAASYAINITGSSAKLTTARDIALSGAVTGETVAFDGSKNIKINVTALDPSALSGAVPVIKGGTGAETAIQARANLGLVVTEGPSDTTDGRILKVKDFGLGGGMVSAGGATSPLSGFGSYYDGSQSEGGGTFFINIPYTNSVAGFRISNTPYQRRFFLHAANSSEGTLQPAVEIYHTGNLDWDRLNGKPATFRPDPTDQSHILRYGGNKIGIGWDGGTGYLSIDDTGNQPIWSGHNFDPNTKVNTGTLVQWSGAEYVMNTPGANREVRVPSGYVMTGFWKEPGGHLDRVYARRLSV